MSFIGNFDGSGITIFKFCFSFIGCITVTCSFYGIPMYASSFMAHMFPPWHLYVFLNLKMLVEFKCIQKLNTLVYFECMNKYDKHWK